MRTRTWFIMCAAVALVAALLLPSVAGAYSTIIYVNKGVAGATLGMRDSLAAQKIGRVVRSGRDSSYTGQTVYYYYFGRRSGGKYAVEMYSNSRRKVFTFVVNSSLYKTTKGVHVGTAEATLRRLYPGLRRYPGPVYTRYAYGGRTGTDFYVRARRITRIVVRTY